MTALVTGQKAITALSLALVPVTRAIPGVRLGPGGRRRGRPPASRGAGTSLRRARSPSLTLPRGAT